MNIPYLQLDKLPHLEKGIKSWEDVGLVVVPSERVVLRPLHIWAVQANTIWNRYQQLDHKIKTKSLSTIEYIISMEPNFIKFVMPPSEMNIFARIYHFILSYYISKRAFASFL